jgi:predicted O-methyltransferase YrrM
VSNKTFTLSDELHRYLLSVSPEEAEVLRRLRVETASDPKHNMQIAPEQGHFMQFLVKLIRAENTIEIGVYTGYSTLATALALPHHGRIVACDVSEEWTSVGRRYWREAGVDHKIDLRIAPALDTLDHLVGEGSGRFDFVFIDADKENYGNYLERAAILLRKGGMIAVDNVLWSGRVADPNTDDQDARSLHQFNLKLKDDQRWCMSMIPIADGLTLAMKV